MKIKLMALSALATLVVPTSANAAVIFNVAGTFTTGGTLTGTFTTNDAITQVIGLNLVSSANGAFEATTYADTGVIDSQRLPNSFRLTVNAAAGTAGKQLQLVFSPSLTTAGSTIGGNSFEAQQIIGAGNRSINGTASVQPAAAVPEPATWAMMLVGFGMVAGASRYRRRNTATSYA